MSAEFMAQQEILTGMIDEQIDTSELEGRYLTFYSAGLLYGVPIADVVQIVGMQDITPIPTFPAYAKGVINLRGNVIPVIDVRLRFGKQEVPYDERTCIMITVIKGSAFGFIVDAVDAVLEIAPEQISPAPRITLETVENAFLGGVARLQKGLVLLMDTEKVLSVKTVEAMLSDAQQNETLE